MSCYIAIDGGTTNTRVHVVRDGEILEIVRLPYGSNPRDRDHLPAALRAAVCELKNRYKDPACVLGSGMLTSECGLAHIPHLLAPAGVRELHRGMVSLPSLTFGDMPVFLIPGVCTAGKDFLQVDMVRGEETELIGLVDTPSDDCVYILPGSHSKILRVDEEGRLLSIRSFMTGEMQAALAGHTILSGSVDIRQPADDDYLREGYEFTARQGVNEALLKVRTMDVVFHEPSAARYGFFLGAILYGEVSEIIKTPERRVVVGGQPRLKDATCRLLAMLCDKEVIEIPQERAATAVVRGMVRIYEYREEGETE